MDYKKIYEDLIASRKLLDRKRIRNIKDEWENHHIIPKSKVFGGSNDKDNLVLLTWREHFVAHLLLTKCYESMREKKSAGYAFTMMCMENKSGRRIVSSHQYEMAKQMRRDLPGPRVGMKNSEESKQKASEALKGHEVKESTREIIRSKRHLQGPLTEAGKKAISDAGKRNKGIPLSVRIGPEKARKIQELFGFAVIQLAMSGEMLFEYISMTEAAKQSGIGYWKINRAAKGIVESAGGFVWKYKNRLV